MIILEGVKKTYGSVTAVAGISLEIQRGEVVGLLGPNGAGKSTTLRMITGYLRPTSGSIQVAGFDLARDPSRARQAIGYLPETAPLHREMVAYDFLLFSGRMRGLSRKQIDARLRDLAPACGIAELIHRPIGQLSKGQKQRVGLTHALLGDPEVLVLDEPTSGLDPNQILEFRKLLATLARDKTVLLSTHQLAEVEASCRRVAIMDAGKIVVDKPLGEARAGDRLPLERIFAEATQGASAW